MEKQRKCPACGAMILADAAVCPACGLAGLNQLFLDRMSYEKWMKEVLEPHRAGLITKVFAADGYGLILTAKGELYGIGRNSCGQTAQRGYWFDSQPHLMAREVISAAAGREYAIYVTRDGEVHLQGRGEIAERFTGFSGAETVWTDEWDRYWILDREGMVYGFGDNSREEIAPRQTRLWKRLERESCVVRYGTAERWESGHPLPLRAVNDEFEVYRELNMAIQNRDEYREAVERFSGSCVHIQRTETQSEQTALPNGQPQEYVEYMDNKILFTSARRYSCIPEIWLSNDMIYAPVACPDRLWMKDTPHRMHSMPMLPEGNMVPEGMRKVVGCYKGWLQQRNDGSVVYGEWCGDQKMELDWLDSPVEDLAVHDNFVILSCGNGDILWNEYWFPKEKKKWLKAVRLPEEKQ